VWNNKAGFLQLTIVRVSTLNARVKYLEHDSIGGIELAQCKVEKARIKRDNKNLSNKRKKRYKETIKI
jgi:hypothetical protein